MVDSLCHGATAQQVNDFYSELYEFGGIALDWAPLDDSIFNQVIPAYLPLHEHRVTGPS